MCIGFIERLYYLFLHFTCTNHFLKKILNFERVELRGLCLEINSKAVNISFPLFKVIFHLNPFFHRYCFYITALHLFVSL